MDVALISDNTALLSWCSSELGTSFSVKVIQKKDALSTVLLQSPDAVLIDGELYLEIELCSLVSVLFLEHGIGVAVLFAGKKSFSLYGRNAIPVINIYKNNGALKNCLEFLSKYKSKEKVIREDFKSFHIQPEGQLVFPEWEGSFMISRSSREFFSLLKNSFESDLPVLLLGESGSGKGFAARIIHAKSARKKSPFCYINVCERKDDVLFSELCGTEKGSFTGVEDKEGIFSAVKDGTLFIDEIAEMSLASQCTFLGILDSHKYRKIGGTKEYSLEARLLYATDANLELLVSRGSFKKQLYYRISVLVLRVPPLREHKEDIDFLSRRFALPFGKILTEKAIQKLYEYSWPGNVRELKHCVERACSNVQSINVDEKDITFESCFF